MFAAPISASTSFRSPAKLPRKRKRHGHVPDLDSSQSREDGRASEIDVTRSVEYTAVVSPAERSQRRLAGLPLDQEPPPFPFPHATSPSNRVRAADEDHARRATRRGSTKQSLHAQHLAKMTTLLHRSIMSKDCARAGRALGLILSNEIGGHAIDIRNGGLWGIGAEILLWQGSGANTNRAAHGPEQYNISREGFERAKLYYERLMIQYPRHKTWPDVVNALDFCIAMYGLWIYITNEESLQLQQQDTEDETSSVDNPNSAMLAAKNWELDQAKVIAESMDSQMRHAPFNGDAEMIRLRAMVALWTADLIDACAELEEQYLARSDTFEPEDEGDLTNQIERMVINPTQVSQQQQQQQHSSDRSDDHRKLATNLFSKLHNKNDDDGAASGPE